MKDIANDLSYKEDKNKFVMKNLISFNDFYYPLKLDNMDEKAKNTLKITHRTIEWLVDQHLVPDDYRLIEHFYMFNSGGVIALAYPFAHPECLLIINEVYLYLFLIDDTCDGDWGDIDQNFAGFLGLRKLLSRYFYSGDKHLFKNKDIPLLTGAADLRKQIVDHSSEKFAKRLAKDFDDYLQAVEKEGDLIAALNKGIFPTAEQLINVRKYSGAAYIFMDLVELAMHKEIPDDVFYSKEITELRDISGRVTTYINDMLSVFTEREGGHPLNLILSEMHYNKNATFESAVRKYLDLHNRDMRRFGEVLEKILNSKDSSEIMKEYALGINYATVGFCRMHWKAKRYSKTISKICSDFEDIDTKKMSEAYKDRAKLS